MSDELRELLIADLNYFKMMKIIRDEQERYGVKLEGGRTLVPTEYADAKIYLRANKYFPYSMKPIIWVLNHDHKEAHMGPELVMSRFTHYSSIYNDIGTLRGILNNIINNIRYQDIPIERITPDNVMTFSFKNKEIHRPFV